MQVIQVEIRDLLRRTLDSEAEVIHLTELLKEVRGAERARAWRRRRRRAEERTPRNEPRVKHVSAALLTLETSFRVFVFSQSHARMMEITNSGDAHLEKVLHGYEERFRELKVKVEGEASGRILAAETRFKREKMELEERGAFAESEMNHRLKTNFLETEQKIYEREAEGQARLKSQAREAEAASDSYKHQLANLTSELQAEKR